MIGGDLYMCEWFVWCIYLMCYVVFIVYIIYNFFLIEEGKWGGGFMCWGKSNVF